MQCGHSIACRDAERRILSLTHPQIQKERIMRKVWLMLLVLALGIGIGLTISSWLARVEAQSKPGTGFAAVPGELGSQDLTGAYEVVKNWPQDISTLPGNEKWTWGAGESVFAESPNRVYLLFRGELPNVRRPQTKLLSEFGPSIQFPINRLPWRDATQSALPGPGTSGIAPEDSVKLWKGTVDVDAKWEN